MKKLILLAGVLVGILAITVVRAQSNTNEGVITYEVKVNLHRRLPNEQMKAMVPEFRTTKQALNFNQKESLYKPIIEDEEESFGSGGMQIRMRQPNDEVYIDREAGTIITKREFMGKDYLISDSVKMKPWKFGTETKEILGYVCRQAYYTDQTQPDRKVEVTAWYTDQLPAGLAPETLGTLPGAVLAIDFNNAERVIVARAIDLRPLKKNEMKIPKSGQEITPAEFRKLVDEQTSKMRANGGVIIRN